MILIKAMRVIKTLIAFLLLRKMHSALVVKRLLLEEKLAPKVTDEV